MNKNSWCIVLGTLHMRYCRSKKVNDSIKILGGNNDTHSQVKKILIHYKVIYYMVLIK